MMTGSVIAGRAEVGVMVLIPAPEILKEMVSKPARLLASMIACRREPTPLSAVFETVKVAALDADVITAKESAKRKNRFRPDLRHDCNPIV